MPVVPEAATVVLTAAPTAASVAAQMLTAAVTGSQLRAVTQLSFLVLFDAHRSREAGSLCRTLSMTP
jgi:hypothetical protein